MESLVVHASFGEGHKQAARAVAVALEAPCRDLLEFCPGFISRIYSATYMAVTQKLPWVWQVLFSGAKCSLLRRLIDSLNGLVFSRFSRYLLRERPRIVITTHFFSLPLLARLKARLGFKLIVVVTDMRVHPLWVDSCVDYYFVALPEGEQDLLHQGIAADKVICGLVPLREGFFRALSPDALRQKFALDQRPCLVLVSSLRGEFPFIRELLSRFSREYNMFIIYGKNRRLKRYLEGLNNPGLRLFAFCEEIWELFELSSVIIAKPGGLTVFEGIYKRKPFVFTHFIPGQEKQNMDILIKYGIARFAQTPQGLIEGVSELALKPEAASYPLKLQDLRPALQGLVCNLLESS